MKGHLEQMQRREEDEFGIIRYRIGSATHQRAMVNETMMPSAGDLL